MSELLINHYSLKGDLYEDPVRSNLDYEFRTTPGSRRTYSLREGNKTLAVLCMAVCSDVPINMQELEDMSYFYPVFTGSGRTWPSVGVFYTVWSYEKGAGREIVMRAAKHLLENNFLELMPTLRRLVTLSPPTEMARKFHLANGAEVFRENEDSVNYEYSVTKCLLS
jgi:hypothetical protein